LSCFFFMAWSGFWCGVGGGGGAVTYNRPFWELQSRQITPSATAAR